MRLITLIFCSFLILGETSPLWAAPRVFKRAPGVLTPTVVDDTVLKLSADVLDALNHLPSTSRSPQFEAEKIKLEAVYYLSQDELRQVTPQCQVSTGPWVTNSDLRKALRGRDWRMSVVNTGVSPEQLRAFGFKQGSLDHVFFVGQQDGKPVLVELVRQEAKEKGVSSDAMIVLYRPSRDRGFAERTMSLNAVNDGVKANLQLAQMKVAAEVNAQSPEERPDERQVKGAVKSDLELGAVVLSSKYAREPEQEVRTASGAWKYSLGSVAVSQSSRGRQIDSSAVDSKTVQADLSKNVGELGVLDSKAHMAKTKITDHQDNQTVETYTEVNGGLHFAGTPTHLLISGMKIANENFVEQRGTTTVKTAILREDLTLAAHVSARALEEGERTNSEVTEGVVTTFERPQGSVSVGYQQSAQNVASQTVSFKKYLLNDKKVMLYGSYERTRHRDLGNNKDAYTVGAQYHVGAAGAGAAGSVAVEADKPTDQPWGIFLVYNVTMEQLKSRLRWNR